MMLRSFVMLLAAALPTLGVESANTMISKGSLTTHVYYLASDELQGRATGSEGIDLAAEYIAKEFESYGLKPGGDNGTYFQKFEVPIRKTLTDEASLTFDGLDAACKLREDFITMPFSSANDFEGGVVFVGYGIKNEDKKYNDYEHVDAEGKVVLMFRYEPRAWTEEAGDHTPDASFMSKVFTAKDHGALAVLMVNPPGEEDGEDRLYRFRAGSRGGDYGLPMFNLTRAFTDKLLAAGGLSDVKSLYERVEKGDPHAYVELKDITVRGVPGLEANEVPAQNVIGILPGVGPLADEYVVFGAHYDHLGNVTPTMRAQVGVEQDPEKAEIHNGADDNASGTAGVLELARTYAMGPTPKRSLVFMTFTGEEMGLLGSAHFVNHPTIPLDKVVAMINLDMIGRLGDKPLQVIGTKTAREFEDIVTNRAKDMTLDIGKTGSYRMAFGGSDHQSFYQKEIPVLFAFTGLHTDYHKPSDDADKIDFEGQARVLEYLTAVADDIINMDQRPTYEKVAAPAGGRLGRSNMPSVRMGIIPSYADSSEEPGWPIQGVSPEGPAANAGMKESDRILKIAGEDVAGIYDYMRILKKYKPNDEVEVLIQRGDEQLTVKVKLEGR